MQSTLNTCMAHVPSLGFRAARSWNEHEFMFLRPSLQSKQLMHEAAPRLRLPMHGWTAAPPPPWPSTHAKKTLRMENSTISLNDGKKTRESTTIKGHSRTCPQGIISRIIDGRAIEIASPKSSIVPRLKSPQTQAPRPKLWVEEAMTGGGHLLRNHGRGSRWSQRRLEHHP
jgi:hypothetical protein